MTYSIKIDEIIMDLPNVFAIADEVLVVGNDANGRDHGKSINE